MKISISRFKSIETVEEFSFDGFTLLAGANSSGKSSLIQALLLLKQTLESASDDILALRGNYVYARDLPELVYKNSQKGTTIKLEWNKNELKDCGFNMIEKYARDGSNVTSVSMDVTFKKVDSAITVIDFNFALDGTENIDFLNVHFNSSKKRYELKTNMPSIYSSIKSVSSRAKQVYVTQCKADFINFFPIFLTSDEDGLHNRDITLLILKEMRGVLSAYLKNIYHIGPNRISPVLDRSYSADTDLERVDSMGTNTRYILAERKAMKIGESTLREQVNYWVQQMGLAQEVSSDKNNESKKYTTSVRVNGQLRVDLCNTGFGNSQILPIIVQGLLAPKGSILIVEDPEVHMHPAVQAAITDFFIAMIEEGKNVIIETHSDHIVTRIRRRVSEKPEIRERIHICFVENTDGHSEYVNLNLDDQATFTTYPMLPKGFLDSQDEDYREIMKNKMARK